MTYAVCTMAGVEINAFITLGQAKAFADRLKAGNPEHNYYVSEHKIVYITKVFHDTAHADRIGTELATPIFTFNYPGLQ